MLSAVVAGWGQLRGTEIFGWTLFLFFPNNKGLPYHISALYVVDLVRFRQFAAGDQLREQYQGLSRDPNSLSNLDQDLPNNMIHQVGSREHKGETWCVSATSMIRNTRLQPPYLRYLSSRCHRNGCGASHGARMNRSQRPKPLTCATIPRPKSPNSKRRSGAFEERKCVDPSRDESFIV